METASNPAEKTKEKEKEHINKIEKEITNSQRTDNATNQPNQILTISLQAMFKRRRREYFKHCAAAQRPGLRKLRFEARAA